MGTPRNILSPEFIRSRVDIDPVTGCWMWRGSLQTGGYGQVRIDNHNTLAHRASYQAFNPGWDRITDRRLVCHSCDTPTCCNPEHLFLGTHLDNFRDAVNKGRSLGAFPDGSQKLLRRRKLNRTQCEEIAASTGPLSETAGKYGIAVSTVCRIRNGSRKTLASGIEYVRTSTRGRKRPY